LVRCIHSGKNVVIGNSFPWQEPVNSVLEFLAIRKDFGKAFLYRLWINFIIRLFKSHPMYLPLSKV
jgi:hypothetical protein